MTVHYGKIPAARDISIEVAQGEAVGLIGPNGAGKTTTLASVAGLIHPSSGEIRLDGQALSGLAPEDILRRGVALVPEGRRIFTTLTVAENLLVGAISRTDKQGIASDTQLLLERFPVLGRYTNHHAGKLSGGEQQQLAIARALLSKPRLLLIDEPSLGLAPLLVDEVFALLNELRDEGVTVLLVEQNAQRTVEFCQKTYVMAGGVIRDRGTAEQLAARSAVQELYLGEFT